MKFGLKMKGFYLLDFIIIYLFLFYCGSAMTLHYAVSQQYPAQKVHPLAEKGNCVHESWDLAASGIRSKNVILRPEGMITEIATIDTFLLVSSDSDFVPLAERLFI